MKAEIFFSMNKEIAQQFLEAYDYAICESPYPSKHAGVNWILGYNEDGILIQINGGTSRGPMMQSINDTLPWDLILTEEELQEKHGFWNPVPREDRNSRSIAQWAEKGEIRSYETSQPNWKWYDSETRW